MQFKLDENLPPAAADLMSTEFGFGKLAKQTWGRKTARFRSDEHLVRFSEQETPGSVASSLQRTTDH